MNKGDSVKEWIQFSTRVISVLQMAVPVSFLWFVTQFWSVLGNARRYLKGKTLEQAPQYTFKQEIHSFIAQYYCTYLKRTRQVRPLDMCAGELVVRIPLHGLENINLGCPSSDAWLESVVVHFGTCIDFLTISRMLIAAAVAKRPHEIR